MYQAFAQLVVKYRLVVLGLWAMTAVMAISRASHVEDVLEVEGRSLKPTESRRAEQTIRSAFPSPVAQFMAVVVKSPRPLADRDFRRFLESLIEVTEEKRYVNRVVSFLTTEDSSLISRDGRTTFFLATITIEKADSATDFVPDLRESLDRRAQRFADASEYEWLVTGGPALDYDVRTLSTAEAKRAEQRALPLTAVVLILAFGSLVAAALPLIIGVFAITVSLWLVYMMSAFHEISVFVVNIVTMVGLATGIDYSLFVVTRFREEMSRGFNAREAAVRTITTAGRAVITSGLTVAVGFASLLILPVVELRSLGIGGLLVVTASVALSITLLPAGLALLGRNIDKPRWLTRKLAWYHAPQPWERWAKWLGQHPWRAIALGTVVMTAITWPLADIEIGLPREGWFPSGTESTDGVTALEEIGSRGSLQPIRIVIQAPEGERVVGTKYLRGLRRLSDTIKTDPRVAQIRGPVDIQERMSIFRYSMLYSDLSSARRRFPEFFEAYLSESGRTVLMDVFLSDTTSLGSAMDVVREIRHLAAGGVRGLDSVEVLVGGFAAASVDLQDDLLRQFPTVIALVVGITAVMLFVAFQSVLVPLKAVVMNLLSVAGAFGLMVLVFQKGVGAGIFGLSGPTEAIYVAVPVMVFAIVFGLSMDYEVFLLSRMKEAFDRTHRNDQATMEGIGSTASVITSAAAVMIIVFGAFSFSKVFVPQLTGFGLAVAVFLDATLIRMVLVPAIMHIAGRWNWWPGVREITPPEGPARS